MLAIQAVLSRQEKSACRYGRRTHKLQQSKMDENGGKHDLQKKNQTQNPMNILFTSLRSEPIMSIHGKTEQN